MMGNVKSLKLAPSTTLLDRTNYHLSPMEQKIPKKYLLIWYRRLPSIGIDFDSETIQN